MASEKLKLYYFELARSIRIIWLVKEMGVEADFEFIRYEPGKDKEKDAAYRRDVHPNGTIPALVIPGPPRRVMLESGAMCLYLAERYGKMLPKPENRLEYYDFAIYGNSTIDELVNFFWLILVMKVEYPSDKVKTMRTKLNTCWKVLADHLKGRDYICGKEITAVDCIVGYDLIFAAAISGGTLVTESPEIMDYFNRLQARPAVKATMAMKG